MKGTIHKCLGQMVRRDYGTKTWQECLKAAGFDGNREFTPNEDVEEDGSLNLVVKTSEKLGLPLQQLYDDFGEYWCCHYAPEVYSFWYIGIQNSKDMILKLDRIHSVVGKHFNGARPPHFEYEWLDDQEKELKVTYDSDRSLIDLYVGLAKGVGVWFKEDIKVEKINYKQVKISFPN